MAADIAFEVRLLRLRSRLAADEVLRRLEILRKTFDPNQPRLPAGQPGGGQWAPGAADPNNGSNDNDGSQQETGDVRIAMPISPERERECELQFDRDIFHCNMVGLRSCYAQAYVRLAACLVGHPIPPLNY